jgi:hypothetical protein
MNDLMPTVCAGRTSLVGGKANTLNEHLTGTSEMGHHNANSIAENKKITTPNVGRKILAPGGDVVFKIIADIASMQDPLKANKRATAETLI